MIVLVLVNVPGPQLAEQGDHPVKALSTQSTVKNTFYKLSQSSNIEKTGHYNKRTKAKNSSTEKIIITVAQFELWIKSDFSKGLVVNR